MSSRDESQNAWDDPEFWRLFQHLESDHVTVLCEHEAARRNLERVVRSEESEFMAAWADYMAAVLRLDDAASALADLQPASDSAVALNATWLSEQA